MFSDSKKSGSNNSGRRTKSIKTQDTKKTQEATEMETNETFLKAKSAYYQRSQPHSNTRDKRM